MDHHNIVINYALQVIGNHPITDVSCSDDLGKLFNNELYSDLILNVDGKKFYVDKDILVIRSEYFRTMLASDMSESSKKEITIVESNVQMFGKLLRYIYTGVYEFTNTKAITEAGLNEALDIFTMANKYLFTNLQRSIETRLGFLVSSTTFCSIYSAAFSCSAKMLILACLNKADSKPWAILRQDGFSSLQVGAIKELISRKSFEKYQSEVFTAVFEWITTNGGKEKCAKAADILLSEIKLERMPISFLKGSVYPSGLFPDSRILKAIYEAQCNAK